LLEEAVEPLSDRIKDIEEALKELTSAKETL
jgi:prefoldin subunit 5